jgi:hypothetical protein
MKNSLCAYLEKYTEKEIHLHRMNFGKKYQSALVVPAFEEDPAFIPRLLGETQQLVLLILVANAPPEQNHRTRQYVASFCREHPHSWKNQHLSLHSYSDKCDILLVDRSQNDTTIPRKQGVGLARKIGSDLALALIDQGIVRSPWIRTTDADVQLPAAYFEDSDTDSTNTAARLYPFTHDSSSDISIASNLYEFSLHYYVAGLHWSNSPYAFHTIGSTLSVHYRRYAEVRGFPKRAAGEDFYLLNKLAKVGGITTLKAPVIAINARLSSRTPFGTGHALGKINTLSHPVEEYLFYSPNTFLLLRDFLSVLPEIWPNRSHIDIDFLCKNAESNQQQLKDCLEALDVPAMLRSGLTQYKSSVTFERHFNNWFDGFRTLKFIHYLRNNYFPSVPLKYILKAPFISNIDADLQHRISKLLLTNNQ